MALLNKNEISAFTDKYSEWHFENNSIIREFELKNFSAALSFTVSVGIEAEKSGHHPDIKLHSWNKVTIILSTHSEGGVTEKDLDLAHTIEDIL
jgi:4a-hydroxytetrahydrobiopterin dehydratase